VLLKEGIAFVADLVSAFPRVRLQGLLATDWGQISASLARLQAARPEWFYTGHSLLKMPGSLLAKMVIPSR
jgi:hypothetical protein